MDISRYHHKSYQPHFEHWKSIRAAFPEPFLLEFPVALDTKQKTATICLDEQLSSKISGLVNHSEPGVLVIFTSALQALLSSYTGKTEIQLQLPGESGEGDWQEAPFAQSIDGNTSIRELLTQTRQNYQHFLRFIQLPLKLVEGEKLGSQSNVHLSYDALHPVPSEIQAGFLFRIIRRGNCFEIRIKSKNVSISAEQLNALLRHYSKVLEQIIQVELKISELNLLDKNEIAELVQLGTENFPPVSEIDLLTVIQQKVAESPDQIAIQSTQGSLSYAELWTLTRKYAFILRENYGIQEGNKVAILLNRCPEAIAAMLASLYLGAAYVPIDPDYPDERIRFLLEDSQASILISKSPKDYLIPVFDPSSIGEVELPKLALSPVKSSQLAYIIYTSGTTGLPKGCQISRGNLSHYIHWARAYYLNQEAVHFGLFTSLSFDLTVTSIYTTLCNGGCIHLFDESTDLSKVLREACSPGSPIDCLKITPAHLSLLPYLDLEQIHLKKIILGGEALSLDIVKKLQELAPGIEVYNEYGPTETTVGCCVSRIEQGAKLVTIGKPASGYEIYLTDKSSKLVPFGCIGEICIAGKGLGMGYYQRPELNQERFVEHPLIAGQKMYRSGDLGCWDEDGNLHCLGRIDEQLKINGYRIEPQEIEQQILSLNEVQQVLVTPVDSESQERYLASFHIGGNSKEIREALQEKLPAYMIPKEIRAIDSIPFTTHGKVDRNALLRLLKESRPKDSQLPLTGKMEKIWAQVLGKADIRRSDHFFERGGDSLQALKLISLIYREYGLDIQIELLFDYPILEQFENQLLQLNETEINLIPNVSEASHYPLSAEQSRMFALQQLNPESTAYNMPSVLELKGKLDPQQINVVINQLLERHESLRSNVQLIDGNAVQLIRPYVPIELEMIQESEQEISQLMERFCQPFDLAQDLLFRVRVVERTKENHLLLIDMHHIVGDGLSMEILTEEFTKLYAGATLNDLTIQYKDYASWQQDFLKSEQAEKSKDYWLQKLAGEHSGMDLPYDYARPASNDFSGARVECQIDAKTHQQVREFVRKKGATPFMFYLGIYQLLLAKYTGSSEITVGSPVAGRPHPDLESLVGIFINTLVYRQNIDSQKNFQDYFDSVMSGCREAINHQHYPFDQLIKQLDLPRQTDRNPVFDVLFVHQSFRKKEEVWKDLEVNFVSSEYIQAKFDLNLSLSESEEDAFVSLVYRTQLFKEASMKRFLDHYKQLITAVLEAPEQVLEKLSPVSEEELSQLERFNATEQNIPVQSVLNDFLKQVAECPESTALVFGEKEFSYAVLDQISTELSAFLRRQQNLQEEDFIGIKLPSSEWLIISILAIWKASCAYVPIDPEYPEERVRFIQDDSQCRLLIDKEFIDSFQQQQSKAPAEIILPKAEQLAYVIYTSGSTGKPKGVQIEHRQLNNYNYWFKEHYNIDSKDSSLLLSNIAFDGVNTSIFGCLTTGACLHIVSKEQVRDVEKLSTYLQLHQISFLKITPPLLHLVMEDGPSRSRFFENRALRLILIGGEQINEGDVRIIQKGRPEVQLINHYGPTETTIGVLCYELKNWDSKSIIPIGQAISNTEILILDEEQQEVGIGIPGEIYIGGKSLARSYLRREGLTTERFIVHPFKANERLYKSGDIGRWTEDGQILFLGRRDDQVKVRGYRVELGEIRSHLLELKQVRDAWVNLDEKKELLALVSLKEAMEVSEFRQALSTVLPEHMLPHHTIFVEEIPLNAHGKLDRNKLQKIIHEQEHAEQEENPELSPNEQLLMEIWKELLGKTQIGVKQDFFSLGGDSIKAIQLQARLRNKGKRLEIREIFQQGSIRKLAPFLREDTRNFSQESIFGPIRLSPIQQNFLENSEVPEHFNMAVLLEKGSIEPIFLKRAWGKLIEHHDLLRMAYREGESWIQDLTQFKWEIQSFELPAHEEEAFILKQSQELQESFSFDGSPLFRIAHFQGIQHDFLLILCHHLIIDGISWRILLEDFSSLYTQIDKAQKAVLPLKTSSFKDWTETLPELAKEMDWEAEIPYWEQILDKPTSLVESQIGELSEQDSFEQIHFDLDLELSESLLGKCNERYGTEINDLLMTALAKSLARQSNKRTNTICLEGHGREEIAPNLDLSRTIGWFTSTYPLRLNYDENWSIEQLILESRKSLREVPNKGIGFSILKYYSSKSDRTVFDRIHELPIKFNYLGQTGQELKNDDWLFSGMEVGQSIHEKNREKHRIDITGISLPGGLHLNFHFHKGNYSREWVNSLGKEFVKVLSEIASHCLRNPNESIVPLLLHGSPVPAIEKTALTRKFANEQIELLYPLSPMQEGLLFQSILNEQSPEYWEQSIFTLQGPLEPVLLRKAYEMLIARHDILRTRFIYQGLDTPMQVLFKTMSPEIREQDISHLAEDKQSELIQDYLHQEASQQRKFETDALMQLTIFRLGAQKHRIVWSNHHILLDGWCKSILIREFIENYLELEKSSTPKKASVNPYRNYISWLLERNQLAASYYWKNYLANYEQVVKIPFENTQKEGKEASAYYFSCGQEQTKALKKLASEQQTTLNTLIQTIWGVLLQFYNNTQDVVFGQVVSGRPAEIEGIEEMVGLFINTIPIRINTTSQQTFQQLVQQVQQQSIESTAYDYYPLQKIVQEHPMGSDLIRQLYVYENVPTDEQEAPFSAEEIQLTDFEAREETNYDLCLYVVPSEELGFKLAYKTACFEHKHIEQLVAHFKHLIEKVLEQASVSLTELSPLSKKEETAIIKQLTGPQKEYHLDHTVIELFREQVIKTPNKEAIQYGKDVLTYRELEELSNRMAGRLIEFGLNREDIIALHLERSLKLIPVIMACWKSGLAYVPIDPAYPLERKEFMLRDAQAKILLGENIHYLSAQFEGVSLSPEELISDHPIPTLRSGPQHLAYVIYTSGSTGQPKGVAIEHGALSSFLQWAGNEFATDDFDTVLAATSYSFDLSLFEFFHPLTTGKKVQLLDSPLSLADAIQQDGSFLLNTVPSVMQELLEQRISLRSIKAINLAGEPISLKIKEILLKQRKLLRNLYGPSEDTTYSTIHSVCEIDGRQLIGLPIDNSFALLLNDHGQVLSPGCIGELHLGGEQLARHYLHREELSQERFIENPRNPEQRIYKTGDLAMLNDQGILEFMGRKDDQIKLRGLRIELSEIQTVLERLREIEQCIVVLHQDESEQQLVAYYRSEEEQDAAKLKQFLADQLPESYLPAFFIHLSGFPLTPNGKVDKKRLPSPTRTSGNSFEAPRGVIETRLAEIWKKVLKVERVGRNNHFFELGGHSLKLLSLLGYIEQEFTTGIPLKELFGHPVLHQQAALTQKYGGNKHRIPRLPEAKHYPLSPAQNRLWLLDQVQGSSEMYHISSWYHLEETLDYELLKQSIHLLSMRQESLRTSFRMKEGTPVQYIEEELAIDLPLEELEKNESLEHRMLKLEEQYVHPAFDLSQGPLWRICLLREHDRSFYLLIVMHHIISDGWSMNVARDELTQIYQHLKSGKTVELPALEIQYRDYAGWQTEQHQSENFREHQSYWIQQLGPNPEEFRFPTDFSDTTSMEGSSYHFSIDGELQQQLEGFIRQHELSLFMLLLGCFQLSLARMSGKSEVLVGSPVAGRKQPEVKDLIGFFLNTVIFKANINREESLEKFFSQLQQSVLNAMEHQDYPFEALIDDLELQRTPGEFPFTSVFFNLLNQNEEKRQINFSDSIQQHDRALKFDLNLYASEQENGIAFQLEFRRHRFREESIRFLTETFRNILKIVVSTPEVTIGELPAFYLEGKKEKEETRKETAPNLVSAFQETLARFPNAPAIRYQTNQLSYQELDLYSNAVALELTKYGKEYQRIGIYLNQNHLIAPAILGILKAGLSYVPLDPEAPRDRIQFMLEDAGINVLISETSHPLPKEIKDVQELFIDEIKSCEQTIKTHIEPKQEAYLLYTSGSTGEPKGVVQTHQNLLYFIRHYIEFCQIDEHDRLSGFTNLTYDSFHKDFFGALLSGAQYFPISLRKELPPSQISDWIAAHQISIVHLTPSVFRIWAAANEGKPLASSLRIIKTTGEATSRNDFEEFKAMTSDHCQFICSYGSTEHSLVAIQAYDHSSIISHHLVSPGKPLYEVEVHVLDSHQKILGDLQFGEIYIESPYLSPGYHHREQENDRHFIQIEGKKLFRSGDLGRINAFGELEITGRQDGQLKINGIRFHVSELENKVVQLPGIDSCVVVADKNHEIQLALYYTGKTTLDPKEIREYLRSFFPENLLPSFYIQLDELPQNLHGKTDRSKLPKPENQHRIEQENYVAPENETEEIICTLWEEILQISPIGVKHSLLDLGVNSLRAMKFVARLESQHQLSLPLSALFRFPTIRELANEVQQKVSKEIKVYAPQASYPVTEAQQRIHVLQELEPSSCHYNLPMSFVLNGQLRLSDLKKAVAKLVEKHAVFRTNFERLDGELRQHVSENSAIEIEYLEDNEKDLFLCKQEFVRPFDLKQGHLLRIRVHRLNEERHLLLIDTHHIICDGISMQLLIRDLLLFYQGKSSPTTPIQFTDYALWLQEEESQFRIKQQEAYWLKQLDGELENLQLPYDRERPELQSFEGKRLERELSQKQYAAIQSFAQKQQMTPFMVLLSCFKLVLHKYSGNQDLRVGTPIAGRNQDESSELIGMFVNTLIIRSQMDPSVSFDQFCQELRKNCVEAFEHPLVPYEKLLDELKVQRDLSRNPLFDVMFVLQSLSDQQAESMDHGLKIEGIEENFDTSKFDLSLLVFEQEQGYRYQLEYATALFDEITMIRFCDCFDEVLDQLEYLESSAIHAISILPTEQKEMLLSLGKGPEISYPELDPVSLFQKCVTEYPDKIAVQSNDTSLTYQELHTRSNGLANILLERQVDRCAILMPKTPDLLVSMVASLKAGACFVLIDPELPHERISFQLKDAEVDLLLSDHDPKISSCPLYQLNPATYSNLDELTVSDKDNDAYILYTSGSTGQPKGVRISRESLGEKIQSVTSWYRWTEQVNSIGTTSISFDVFILEVFSAILNGGSIYLPDNEDRMDFPLLLKNIRNFNVQVLQGTNSYFKQLLWNTTMSDCLESPLEHLIIGGESLEGGVLKQLKERFPGAAVHNHYGPTETTIDAIVYSNLQDFGENIIGKPLPNVEVLILDEAGELVPRGSQGEICLAGISLSPGYLNRDEENKRAFPQHPFQSSKRIYRTGDLGSWNNQGLIRFLGRKDEQVKIRGYRVELNEIRQQILTESDFQDLVVINQQGSSGDQELHAYLLGPSTPDLTSLLSALRKKLPKYMIPGKWFLVDQIPLNRNGKVDRHQLIEQGVAIDNVNSNDEKEVLSEIEDKIRKVWMEVLELQNISRTDHFFDIGGHSLKATQIVSRLRELFKKEISLRDFFLNPDIQSLAAIVENQEQESFQSIPRIPEAENYPLSYPQKRLWMINELMEENRHVYNMYHAVTLSGKLNSEALQKAFQRLMERHESLRTYFKAPDGEPRQYIASEVDFPMEERDFSAEANPEDTIREACLEMANEAFDLEQAPLLKGLLAKKSDQEHILFLSMHHIVSDGWSMELMFREMSQFYAWESRGLSLDLNPLKIQYRDFSAYQQNQTLERDEAYWLKQLEGDLELIKLPYDFMKNKGMQSVGDQVEIQIDEQLTNALKLVAKTYQTSLSNVVFTVFNILLHQLSGQKDLIVGMTIANRNHPDIEKLIGFFVNSLVIRTVLDEDSAFADILEQVKQSTLDAFEHQNYPYDLLVEKLQPERFSDRQALVNVTYSFQNLSDLSLEEKMPNNSEVNSDIELRNFSLGQSNQTTKYDLLLFVNESNNELNLKFEFDSVLFKRASMERYLKFFHKFLEMISEPSLIKED